MSDASIYKWNAKFGRLKGLENENARLKLLLADAMLDNAALKGSFGKGVVTRAAKRNAVAHLKGAFGMSDQRAV